VAAATGTLRQHQTLDRWPCPIQAQVLLVMLRCKGAPTRHVRRNPRTTASDRGTVLSPVSRRHHHPKPSAGGALEIFPTATTRVATVGAAK